MNYDDLNKMILYIEDNLDNEIDFLELSKITKTNMFILERIFSFLTNMTIKEYIKKRRLSKAFEDIRNTNTNIIDIAFKYQYNSSSSFTRAFKQQFNITPSECRKNKGVYQIVPIEHFEENKKYNFNYYINKLNKKEIYGYEVSSIDHSDLLYKIKQLYNKLHNEGIYERINNSGTYGIFCKDSKYHYFVGSELFMDNMHKYVIDEKEYAVFELSSREQKDIVNLEQKIRKQWIPSTNYNIKSAKIIEYYKEDKCYIYLPIE